MSFVYGKRSAQTPAQLRYNKRLTTPYVPNSGPILSPSRGHNLPSTHSILPRLPSYEPVKNPILRLLPRARAVLGPVGLATVLAEMQYFGGDPDEFPFFIAPDQPVMPSARPSVPVTYRPVQRQRGQIEEILLPLVHPYRSRKPTRIVLQDTIATRAAAMRGPEQRLSISSGIAGDKVRLRLRRTGLGGVSQSRRDKKSRSRLYYNAVLRMINRTYGRYSEVVDFAEAFQFNSAMSADGVIVTDWPGVALSLTANEVVDRSIGAGMERYRSWLRQSEFRNMVPSPLSIIKAGV